MLLHIIQILKSFFVFFYFSRVPLLRLFCSSRQRFAPIEVFHVSSSNHLSISSFSKLLLNKVYFLNIFKLINVLIVKKSNICKFVLLISLQSVSKVHAEIEAAGGSTWICDLDSSNKTKLNNVMNIFILYTHILNSVPVVYLSFIFVSHLCAYVMHII